MAKTLRSRVITAADARADSTAREDSYLAKVVRYIPGEIVAAYLAAANALQAAHGPHLARDLGVVTAVLTLLTPFWILYATRDSAKPLPVFQAGAATFAFVVWVFAIPQGPFSTLPGFEPVYGTLALLFSTFVIPIVEKMLIK